MQHKCATVSNTALHNYRQRVSGEDRLIEAESVAALHARVPYLVRYQLLFQSYITDGVLQNAYRVSDVAEKSDRNRRWLDIVLCGWFPRYGQVLSNFYFISK